MSINDPQAFGEGFGTVEFWSPELLEQAIAKYAITGLVYQAPYGGPWFRLTGEERGLYRMERVSE